VHRALATVDSAVNLAPRERAKGDFYCEPAWAVDALIDAERFVGNVYDPACGRGNIPERFRLRGFQAHGSDIADRGYQMERCRDFLGPGIVSAIPISNIVCNPPYEAAEYFIKRALDLARFKVAMLLRWSFAEGGTGKTEKSKLRRWALDEAPLARVYVFANRVSMPPGDMAVEAKGGAVAFGWFVWDHDHQGPPTFRRLWKPTSPKRDSETPVK